MKSEEITNVAIQGTLAVKQLRQKKLLNGLPFMINTRELPRGQCYLEYPGGTIKLVELAESYQDFHVIRELTKGEAYTLRLRYHLL
jgi:hypothetical protein